METSSSHSGVSSELGGGWGGCKGGLGWIFLACGVGEGRYLLKGFFQRSIFRAGVCRKDRGGEQEGRALYSNASLM